MGPHSDATRWGRARQGDVALHNQRGGGLGRRHEGTMKKKPVQQYVWYRISTGKGGGPYTISEEMFLGKSE